jgi:hypothetical protein
MHLRIYADIYGGVNLIWDSYEGFEVKQYNIWRGTDINSMSIIETVPGNISYYTDLNPPAGTNLYQLEAVRSSSCDPDTLGLTYSSSFTYLPGGSHEGINNLDRINLLRIMPNPFNEYTTLKFSNPEGSQYKLYIMYLSGKVCRIVDDIYTSEYVLEKGDLKEGFYFIELRGPYI